MKKYLKLFLLSLIMILFISGCGWDDVKEKYGEVLEKGLSCTYYYQNENPVDYYKVKKMTIIANLDGAYLNLGTGNNITIMDSDEQNFQVYINDRLINFDTTFLQNYIEYYKDNNECPQNLYLNSVKETVNLNSCNQGDSCFRYSTQKPVEKVEPKCHKADAKDCIKTSKNISNDKIYLEFGYYEKNGEIKKYFGISLLENYQDVYISTEDAGFKVTKNLIIYEIPDEVIDKIWLQNNKLVSSNSINLIQVPGTYDKYYILDTSTSIDDIEKVPDNTFVLDKDFSCTYNQNVDNENYPSSIIFENKNSVLSIKLQTSNGILDVESSKYIIDKFFKEEFLKRYEEYGNCYETIYLDMYYDMFKTKGNESNHIKYTLPGTEITDDDGNTKVCNHDNAINCLKLEKSGDVNLDAVKLEFGYYNGANNEVKKYFRVCNDIGCEGQDDAVNEFVVELDKDYYNILEDAISDIWRDGNTFIPKDDIVITTTTLESNMQRMVYISGPNSQKPGENVAGGNIIDVDSPYKDHDIPLLDCTSLLGSTADVNSPAYYISVAFSVVRYVAIILLLALTIMDFVSATVSQDNDALKKAGSKSLKRIIYCVIIFVLPIIIDLVLELINDTQISDCIDTNM